MFSWAESSLAEFLTKTTAVKSDDFSLSERVFLSLS